MRYRIRDIFLAGWYSILVGPVLPFSTLKLVPRVGAAESSVHRDDRIESCNAGDSSHLRSRSCKMPWMSQSFNGQAIASMARVVRRPSLAVPHLSVPHIGYLDFKALRDMGCKGVVFDKDNTLTAPYVDEPHPLVAEGLRRCMEAFPGRVCIMSNSAGTRDDPGYAGAVLIEAALGIPVIRHDRKKPGGIDDVLAFFKGEESDAEQVRVDELCFVGDRLLTDVVFGNLYGMLTLHTRPLSLKGDNLAAILFRFLERKVFLGFFRGVCSVRPVRHRLFLEGTRVLRVKNSAAAAATDMGPAGAGKI